MKKTPHRLFCLLSILLIVAILNSCGPRQADNAQFQVKSSLAPTLTPFQPLPSGAQSKPESNAPDVPDPSPEPEQPPRLPTASIEVQPRKELWVDPLLPDAVIQALSDAQDWKSTEKSQASVAIGFGDGHKLSDWFFALAAPFPTIQDGISTKNLKAVWNGSPPARLNGLTLVMSQFTKNALDSWWGRSESSQIRVLPQNELLETAWGSPFTWAILPFDELEPRWKVMALDGISPIHNDFNSLDYGLRIPISIQGNAGMVEIYLNDSPVDPGLPQYGNRNPDRLTVLAMTGVTALVRATAHTMETIGINYPGQAIRDWLAGADLTHISNEVPFAENCPFPNPNQTSVVFCSDPRYIELLKFVGTDIVELTGDHFHDWGTTAMHFTLDLYEELGWPYYGGGRTFDEGKKPITIEHNGNRLAFIGCNGKGAAFAYASATSPGSVVCDFPYMEAEIKRLVEEGYLPITTFQHYEYYLYEAQVYQIRDFHRVADAGAVIVSGSQAHQPQAMEFYQDAWIHYGLGNLFFDQYLLGTPMRQGFIDRHVFYENKHISTELLTIWFVDFAQPQPMTPEQREDLLSKVFSASGW